MRVKPVPEKLSRVAARYHRRSTVKAHALVAMLCGIIGVCISSSSGEIAEWKPTKILNVLIPFSVGSGNDVAFSPIRKQLEAMGVRCVVEYVPGADGIIGTNRFKKEAIPDGHSLMTYTIGQYAAADIIHKSIKTYEWDDFEPVSLIATGPIALLSKPGATRRKLKDVILDIRSGPRRIGSAGAIYPVLWTSLAKRAEIPENHLGFVSYRAPPGMILDLMRGDLDYAAAPLPTALSLHAEGKLEVVAIASEARKPELPDTETISETFPGLFVNNDWGVVLPKGVETRILQFYVSLVEEVVMNDDVQRYFRVNSVSIDRRQLGPVAYRRHMNQVRSQLLR